MGSQWIHGHFMPFLGPSVATYVPNTSHLWPQINVNEGTYIIDWLPIDQLMIIYIYCILIDYVCRWLTIPVFHSWGSPVVTGRLGIMGSGGSSQARFMVNPNSAGFAIGFTCYFFLRLCLCFVCPPSYTVVSGSTPSFVFTGFKLQNFTSAWGFDMLNFAHGVTLAVSLRRWHWHCCSANCRRRTKWKQPRCWDLRLSKSVNIWELWVARFVACGMTCLTLLAPRFDCLRLKTCAPQTTTFAQ